MGERDDAKHHIEQTRARMTAVAHEVSRRMTADYVKERAGDMAREKMYEMRERAIDHPWFAPLIGAGIGALVGRALIPRARDRRLRDDRDRWYGEEGAYAGRARGYYGAYGPPPREHEPMGRTGSRSHEGVNGGGVAEKGAELREKAGEMASDVRDNLEEKASQVKEKAYEAKDRLTTKTAEYRERIREGAEALANRIPDREAIRVSTQEQPAIWALGAMAVGALFGFALPVSERERQMLEPARDKLRQAGTQAMDQAAARMEGQHDDEHHEPPEAHEAPPSTSLTPVTSVSAPSNEPLH